MRTLIGISLLLTAVHYCRLLMPAQGLLAQRRSDLSLSSFMLERQTVLQATDPAVSSQCFTTYLPLLQSMADQWSTDYSACLATASEARTTALTVAQAPTTDISNAATEICSYIGNCEKYTAQLDILNCYANLADNAQMAVYTISYNASAEASSLQQDFEVIDVSLHQCTNASEHTYVTQTASLYYTIDACLRNSLAMEETATTEADSVPTPHTQDP